MKDITTNRRKFLKNSVKGTVALGIGLSSIGAFSQAFAASKSEVSTATDKKSVPNEELFRMGVIGPAMLSLVTSELAADRATNENAKEFAGFELTEAKAVTKVLKELGTAVPEMDAKATATLNKIKTAADGAAFDDAYIMAQLENHEFLRDHAEDFLKNSSGKTDAEKHGQHLATLALATFKEHVAITKRISGELKA